MMDNIYLKLKSWGLVFVMPKGIKFDVETEAKTHQVS
jgi:hypothetical protein